MLKPMFAAAAIALAFHDPATAATCGTEIERFARQYDLSPQAPSSQGGPSLSAKDLSRSQGEIAPAQQPPARVIEPRTTDPMPTTPEIPQQTGQGPTHDTESTEPGAARRSQMQALLEAAQSAQAQGKEDECLRDLSRARGLPGSG